MKVFIDHELPQGLGKKSLIALPTGDGCIIISIPYREDMDSFFGSIIGGNDWIPDIPTPEDEMLEMKVPNDLGKQLIRYYEKDEEIKHETSELLKKIAAEHRNEKQ